MPRLPRVNIKNCLYYVTQQGNLGENIFKDGGDYKMYLELLKKYKQQYGFKLFSFALMPQQLNLLIELKDGTTISMIMHDITSSYTKYFNSRYERKGHLFRERFKSVIVEKEPYLLNLIRYIHLRPIKLGLSQEPTEYTFSSNLLYLYNSGSQEEKARNLRNMLNLDNEIQEVLDLVGKAFPEKKTYADFMAAVTEEEMQQLGEKLHRTSLLGSEEFMESVKAQMESRKSEAPQEKTQAIPAILFSAVILLAGVVVGVIYVQKNIASKEKEIYRAQKEKNIGAPGKKEEKAESLLADLNGTSWAVKINPSGAGKSEAYLDELKFMDGKVSSKALLSQGFSSTNYTLTVMKDGTLTWETMQRNPGGDVIFWRGEEKEGKMGGVLSKHPAAGKAQDFSFTSTGYRRGK